MSWNRLLDYWFGGWDDHEPLSNEDPQLARWWSGAPAVDAEVRERFADDHARARSGEIESWAQTTPGTLALVILLDQVPRHLFRRSPEAFATDARAQRLVLDAIERGIDRELPLIQRSFLYLPLMHAEDLALQERGVRQYERLAEEAERQGLARADYYRGVVGFAEKHRDLVKRFGRFPHRNEDLGRVTTPEEQAWMAEHGRGF